MTAAEFTQIKEMADMTVRDISFYTGATEAMVRHYARGEDRIPDYVASMMRDLRDDI